jgi:hypothetical protein
MLKRFYKKLRRPDGEHDLMVKHLLPGKSIAYHNNKLRDQNA